MNEDNEKYFYYVVKYKSNAYAVQYVTGYNFYKFNDDDGKIIYSFRVLKENAIEFFKKTNMLNELKNTKIGNN